MSGEYVYRSVSILSSHQFRWKEIDQLLIGLGAVRDDEGWVLARKDRKITIDLGNEDISVMFDDSEIRHIEALLGGRLKGRLSVMFNDGKDGLEALMALGLAKAVAEVWNTVLDDHRGETVLVDPPR